MPVHVIKELNIYLRAAKELEKNDSSHATPEQIAELVDKPLEDVRKILNFNDTVSSIHTPLGVDSTKTLLDIVADENQLDPEGLLGDMNLQESLNTWLRELDERYREVIVRRFGLGEHDEKQTLEEVGEAIGLTRERVRQIQVDALYALRQILERQGLSFESLFDREK